MNLGNDKEKFLIIVDEDGKVKKIKFDDKLEQLVMGLVWYVVVGSFGCIFILFNVINLIKGDIRQNG